MDSSNNKTITKGLNQCLLIYEDTNEQCKMPRYQGYIFCLRHACEIDIGSTVTIANNKLNKGIIYSGHNKRNFRNKCKI